MPTSSRPCAAKTWELSAGRVESTRKEFTVRVARLYNTAEDFGGLVIRQGQDGHLIRLRDVARVERGAEDDRSILRGNRIPMVGLGYSCDSPKPTPSTWPMP